MEPCDKEMQGRFPERFAKCRHEKRRASGINRSFEGRRMDK
jgi:hypothetical protein